ncbi:AAA family ATPase [Stutzerimonas nitrititolerans]|uniref:AAA family ATPase n=1 Tax=Stutzerimonas nitrititolerans TaxID=2482751 RepID=UPI002897C6C5|nr:AAA family ATPase [Stutzerimonas nitrititolerans]
MTSLSADDSYLDHYGFSHDPFAARVPGFKFFPAQRKPVLGQLHHLARYSQLLLVVTGPEGSGKTLVRQALVASSNKQAVMSVVITPQGTADSSAVLQQIGQALNIQHADFDGVMAQIVQLALTGQEVYLLVDDAEQLTGAAVETLLRLAAGSPEARPHVFLFGEDSLVSRLEALVEGEERFHVIALQPYEEDETREYLAQRLEGAGAGLETLSEEQIARIHEQSGGWPGAINLVAREELIEAIKHSKTRKATKGWPFPLPMKHLLAVLAVLCVIAVAFLLRGGEDEPEVQTNTPLALGNAPRSAPESAAGPVTPAESPSKIEFETPAAAEPTNTDSARTAAVEPAEDVSKENSASTAHQDGAAPSPAVTQKEAPAPVAQPAPEPVVPETPASKTPEVVRPAAQPAPAAPAASAHSAWYAEQGGNRYLVQILGTRTEKNAQTLVAQRGSDYRYFVKEHEGKPLYVVTFGNFANRAAALAAIKTLPAALQSGKPWARSFASVQKEMRK